MDIILPASSIKTEIPFPIKIIIVNRVFFHSFTLLDIVIFIFLETVSEQHFSESTIKSK